MTTKETIPGTNVDPTMPKPEATHTTREAMERMNQSERLAYYIAYGRWIAVQIAMKEGTVHSREVREEMARRGVLHGYHGGDFFLGSVFNKFPAFRPTGRVHKYSDTSRNIHDREVKIWELAPGYDTSQIVKPTKPAWLRNAE